MNNELYHYGVPGMRWGKRKRYIPKKGDSEDYAESRIIKEKKVRQMSNSELAKVNKRLGLETQYKELNKKNRSEGAKFIDSILKDTSKALVKDGINLTKKKALDS